MILLWAQRIVPAFITFACRLAFDHSLKTREKRTAQKMLADCSSKLKLKWKQTVVHINASLRPLFTDFSLVAKNRCRATG